MGPWQIQPHRVGQGVMAMKRCSTLLRCSVLEPHHQMQFCVIFRIPLFEKVFFWGCYLSTVNTVSIFYTPPAGWINSLVNSNIFLLEVRTDGRHHLFLCQTCNWWTANFLKRMNRKRVLKKYIYVLFMDFLNFMFPYVFPFNL